jgi:hypothetical protein
MPMSNLEAPEDMGRPLGVTSTTTRECGLVRDLIPYHGGISPGKATSMGLMTNPQKSDLVDVVRIVPVFDDLLQ